MSRKLLILIKFRKIFKFLRFFLSELLNKKINQMDLVYQTELVLA